MPNSTERPAAKRVSPRVAAPVCSIAIAVMLGLTVRTTVKASPPETPPAQPKVCDGLHATIVVDGETRAVVTPPTTVRDLLAAQNIHLGKLDRSSMPLDSLIGDGATITINRVRTEITIQKTTIPFPTKQSYTSSLSLGTRSIKRPGVNGEKTVRYAVTYLDDAETSRVKQGETVKAPVAQLEVLGTRGMSLSSRGYFGGRRIVEMEATGYGPNGNGHWGSRTSSGLKPGFGVVAVDPHFIPLGTRLYIDGYGYAVAGDTGGAIKGNRIDLGRDTNAEACAEGRKKVRVLILN